MSLSSLLIRHLPTPTHPPFPYTHRNVAQSPTSSPFDPDFDGTAADGQAHQQQQPAPRRRFRRFGRVMPQSPLPNPPQQHENNLLVDSPLLRLPPILPLVKPPRATPAPTRAPIETYNELHAAIDAFAEKKARRKALSRLSVVGKTAERVKEHPVLEVLHERVRAGSQPGQRNDAFKVGLAIEGGGMRGAVSAGAAAAVNLLGLSDAFDSVYGSSAGALIAAFFVSRQLNGTIIYSDILPAAGKRFLDRTQLIPAMGLLPGVEAKPVINLQFLEDVVRNTVRLDWESFSKHNAVQPLNIIASNLESMHSLALRSQDGHFECLEGLLRCLKSSMCVPGVAGPPVRLNFTCQHTAEEKEEAFADALIFEPIPFRSAVEDGCTHVVTLRTRPDGSEVLGHKVTGIYERFVAKRYLHDMHKFSEAARHMTQFDHLRQYAADLLLLNEGSHAKDEGVHVPDGKGGGRTVHLLPVAPPMGISEVDTLDSSRDALRKGLRDGFAAAWDLLAPPELAVEHPGQAIADELFTCDDVAAFNDSWKTFSVMFGGGNAA